MRQTIRVSGGGKGVDGEYGVYDVFTLRAILSNSGWQRCDFGVGGVEKYRLQHGTFDLNAIITEPVERYPKSTEHLPRLRKIRRTFADD